MADETKKETAQNNRSKYEPPRATRLSDMQAGSGTVGCSPTGSAFSGVCSTGIGAGLGCSTGTSDFNCGPIGSSD